MSGLHHCERYGRSSTGGQLRWKCGLTTWWGIRTRQVGRKEVAVQVQPQTVNTQPQTANTQQGRRIHRGGELCLHGAHSGSIKVSAGDGEGGRDHGSIKIGDDVSTKKLKSCQQRILRVMGKFAPYPSLRTQVWRVVRRAELEGGIASDGSGKLKSAERIIPKQADGFAIRIQCHESR